MTESMSTVRRGRPRSEASKDAVLASAFEVLCDRGYADLSIEAVASRAGVGKATIYRWWSSRQALAVEAFFTATQTELAFPDTGAASEDFRMQIQQLAHLLRGATGEAMVAMVTGSRHDALLREALATRWIAPRRRWGKDRMLRAIADRECLDGLDPDVALELMYSPIYSRLLFGRPVPSASEVDGLLRIVFAGIFRTRRVDPAGPRGAAAATR